MCTLRKVKTLNNDSTHTWIGSWSALVALFGSSTWICVFNRKENKCLYTYADKNSPYTKATRLPKLIAAWIPFYLLCILVSNIANLIKMKMASSNERRCYQTTTAPPTTPPTYPSHGMWMYSYVFGCVLVRFCIRLGL